MTRVGGGDPENPRAANDYATAIVHSGVGELEVYSGMRTSSERWELEKVEIKIVGAVPVIGTSDKTKYRD